MQWILQDFEDTSALKEALTGAGLTWSVHKVVPFVGELIPAPQIPDPDDVILFGSYTLWQFAERHGLWPGVFRISPFLEEVAWHPFLLNGTDALVMSLAEVPLQFPKQDRDWFMRPVDDSKAEPGRVRSAGEIHALARKVLSLSEDEIPIGALRHDTQLMFTQPVQIEKEWRVWIVEDRVVTYSLYKDGARVTYRPEIDEDALAFVQDVVARNPKYASAYVIDICRTAKGLRVLETNCLNAAGFYAADLSLLVAALEGQSNLA